jgi:WD40 repeat protein
MGEVAIVPGTTIGGGSSGTSRPPIGAEGPVQSHGKRGVIATIEFRDPYGKLVGTPLPVHTLPYGATSPLHDIAAGPDGTYATVGGDDVYVCIVRFSNQSGQWKPDNQRIKLKLNSPGLSVAISRYGKVVVSTLKGVELIDFNTKPPASRILEASKGFDMCVFLKDGQAIACTQVDGTVAFWDSKTGKKSRSESGVYSRGRASLAPGPGSGEVTVGCSDGTIKVVSQAED